MDLTPREQRVVDLVLADIKNYYRDGTILLPYRAKQGDDFRIRMIAQVLHEHGIDITSSYQYDEGQKVHTFRPQPYGVDLSAPRVFSKRPKVGNNNFNDFFGDIFGFGRN